MQKSKSILSSKTRTNNSTQQVNQQIHYLRKLEEYHQLNESLRGKIRIMEEELSRKNASKPVEADLSEVLNDLVKKNTKLESELAKTVHRQNEALAEIKVRKEAIKLARNERVIHSGIFKNIEKEIKSKEDVYKNLLINKRLEELSRNKLEEEYLRNVKLLSAKVAYLKKTIEQTKLRKEEAIETFHKQKESYIIRNSILPTKTSQSFMHKQSIHAINHQNQAVDRVLSQYALVETQERRLLKLAGKESLEEVVELMNAMDNSEMVEKIERMTERISQAEDELKQILKKNNSIEEREEPKEGSENGQYNAKKQLISRINKERELINEMTRRACAIAAQNSIETQNMTDIEVFEAIQLLVAKEPVEEFGATMRSNESTKLTQLLLKSKRSKQYQELISETKFKELFSNLNCSSE